MNTVEYLNDPAHVDALLEAIACGETLKELCGRKGLSFAAVSRFLAAEPERRERHQAAVAIRGELLEDVVIRNLRDWADLDLADAYDEHGALRRLREMPVALRRAITSITVTSAGPGETTTTRIRTVTPEKAVELLGKYRKMFTDKVELGAGPSLADLVRASFKVEGGEGHER